MNNIKLKSLYSKQRYIIYKAMIKSGLASFPHLVLYLNYLDADRCCEGEEASCIRYS